MGLFDRVEQKLERVVNGAFARAFKAEVQPVEIASAMRRAMDDRAAVIGAGRTIVPNVFTVELAPSDYERLTSYSDLLTSELVASVEEHAESQRYTPGGPFVIDFDTDDSLETGVFEVRAAAEKHPAPPRPIRRPATGDGDDHRSADHGAEHDGDTGRGAGRRAAKRAAAEHDDRERARMRLAAREQEAALPAEDEIAVAGQAAAAAGGALAGTAAAARMRRAHPSEDRIPGRRDADRYEGERYDDRYRGERYDDEYQGGRHEDDRYEDEGYEDEGYDSNPHGGSHSEHKRYGSADAGDSFAGDPFAGDPWARPGVPSRVQHMRDEDERREYSARESQRAQDRSAWADGDEDYPAYDPYEQHDEVGGRDGAPLSQEPPHRPAPAPYAAPAPAARPPAPHPGRPVANPAAHPAETAARPVAPPPARRPAVDAAKRPWVEIDGDTYPLILALTSLGRDPGCDITLDDPGISRRHAELRVTHDGPHLIVTLRDLGSTNGTFVNGERVGSTRLSDGDRVTLGRTSLTIRGTGR